MEREDLKELDYGLSIAIQTLVQAMGMFAANQQAVLEGRNPLPYRKESFDQLIEDNGVHHNGVLQRWFRH